VVLDKDARVVRFIGYKPGMRRACCRFSWNTDDGWLWRHKTAKFAERHGLKDIGQMKQFFGSRWAYRLQKRINGEHRMVYKVEGDKLLLAQLRYHY
jgi:hypothetical protein